MFNLNIYFYKLSLAMVFKDHRILMLLLAESWVEILNQLKSKKASVLMNLFLLFRSNKTYLKGCALIRLSHELQIASVTPITPITLTDQLMVSYLILSPTFFGSKFLLIGMKW